MQNFEKPRSYYALCLGTFPTEEARKLRDCMSKSPSCNVQFKFRGRGKRKDGKPREKGGRTGERNCDLPVRDAQMVAVYVSLKPSLWKNMNLAEIRDKMLRAAGYKY